MPPSNNAGAKNSQIAPRWMETLAIIILFATMLGLGGFVWWPFFVGAVLLACLVYWYYSHTRKVQ